ncbi:MAG TPA: right-handed parallel beta-helix repeat-containing protein [Candidatus Binatia bacterium]
MLLLAGLGAAADVAVGAECGGDRRCRCGDVVVADYTLPEDLGPCPASGLRVRRRVVLDGAGHVIRGSGAKGSFGVQVDSGASGSQIRNLAVTGFERGLRLVKVERVRVSGVASHDNGDFKARVGYGIDFAGGASRNVLDHVQVFRNADEGIHLGSGAHENQIIDSQVYDNARENVYFLRNHGNVLKRSELRGAGSTSVYIKDASRTVLEGNRIDGALVHIRGASRETQLIDNLLSSAPLVLQGYKEKGAQIAARYPEDTLVRGGRISADSACVRVDGASGTSLENVALDCSRQVSLAGGATVVAVDTRVSDVQCSGAGELQRARRVEFRVVDAAGDPVRDAKLLLTGAAKPLGTTNQAGMFSGLAIESRVTCPGARESAIESLRIEGDGRSREVPLAELRGDVRL